MDFKALGLMAGIEIHQQLNTREKLFCACPTLLRRFDERNGEFFRYLRATESELGEIDSAAKEEMKHERQFRYYTYDTTCIVENDEEPPGPLNPEAIEICCMIARMFSMTPIPQVHTMRKLVIDGSNTSGFQRTALVAVDGVLPNGGIPLVEITTSPCMRTPEEVHEIARYLGMALRSTGKVKRGLGTIRQDINISIRDGARVEIKGVQDLDLIAEVVRREVQRQKNLLSLREELQGRRACICKDPVDVTGVFLTTTSGILKKAPCILAVRLDGYAGLVGRELQPGRRLGSEFSDYAKKCGVGGIFHTDELPAYGITAEEVWKLRDHLSAPDSECIVLVAADKKKASCAARQVISRAEMALSGVPEETRKMLEDGSSAYMRPLPGAARMYPETDVFPVFIANDWYAGLTLPELLSTKAERFSREMTLDPALASQVAYSDQVFFFERLVKSGIPPQLAARTLLSTLKELARAGTDVSKIREEDIVSVLAAVNQGTAAKEAIPAILEKIAAGVTANDAISACAPSISREDLEGIIRKIVEERSSFIRERGMAALGPLMGVVMGEVRGSVDGKLVSETLRREIARITGK
jgi:glutamyl-tRNA(Gln) amidotransferase subunit E